MFSKTEMQPLEKRLNYLIILTLAMALPHLVYLILLCVQVAQKFRHIFLPWYLNPTSGLRVHCANVFNNHCHLKAVPATTQSKVKLLQWIRGRKSGAHYFADYCTSHYLTRAMPVNLVRTAQIAEGQPAATYLIMTKYMYLEHQTDPFYAVSWPSISLLYFPQCKSKKPQVGSFGKQGRHCHNCRNFDVP